MKILGPGDTDSLMIGFSEEVLFETDIHNFGLSW